MLILELEFLLLWFNVFDPWPLHSYKRTFLMSFLWDESSRTYFVIRNLRVNCFLIRFNLTMLEWIRGEHPHLSCTHMVCDDDGFLGNLMTKAEKRYEHDFYNISWNHSILRLAIKRSALADLTSVMLTSQRFLPPKY